MVAKSRMAVTAANPTRFDTPDGTHGPWTAASVTVPSETSKAVTPNRSATPATTSKPIRDWSAYRLRPGTVSPQASTGGPSVSPSHQASAAPVSAAAVRPRFPGCNSRSSNRHPSKNSGQTE